MEICGLCKIEAELQESHIIPSFVYKWLKKTSVTGFFRSGELPNRRAQDGHKLYLFCRDCEEKLNEWETIFANKIFHPFHNGTPLEPYAGWLLKFSVSISFRVLLFYKKLNELSHFNSDMREASEKALNTWSSFLLGHNKHPGIFQQHMLPFPGIIVENTLEGTPPNINRYIMRSIDLDAFCSKTEAYTFAKLGRIFVFGFVAMKNPEHWHDTKINIDQGDLFKKHYRLPETIKNVIFYKANRALEVQGKMSENQWDRIGKDYREKGSQFRNSEMFKAMDQDHKVFGEDAFKNSK